MSEETYHHFDTVISRLEKLGKLLITALVLIMSGAVWAARIEWRLGEAEHVGFQLKPRVEQHDRQISTIEGRLHGIASQIGRVPGKLAAKLQLQEGACGDP